MTLKNNFLSTKVIVRNKYFWSRFLIFLFVVSLFDVPISYAITGGPKSPSNIAPSVSSIDDMVDPFTGNFNYSVPLVEVPGPGGAFPIHLGYRSGVKLEQEASQVGLGWSLDLGSIAVNKSGLPDVFNGTDKLRVYQSSKRNFTAGVRAQIPLPEIFGFDSQKYIGRLGLSSNVYYNSITGIGLGLGLSTSISASLLLSSHEKSVTPVDASASASINFNSDGSPSVGMNFGLSSTFLGLLNRNAGWSMNGISGIRSSGFNQFNGGNPMLPQVVPSVQSINVAVGLKPGVSGFGVFAHSELTGYFNTQKLDNSEEEIPAIGYLHAEVKSNEAMRDIVGSNTQLMYTATPIISPRTNAYDTYSVGGIGPVGSFRAFRKTLEVSKDRVQTSETISEEVSFDAPVFKAGGNIQLTTSVSGSGGQTLSIEEKKSPTLLEVSSVAPQAQQNNNFYFKYKYDGVLTSENNIKRWRADELFIPSVLSQGRVSLDRDTPALDYERDFERDFSSSRTIQSFTNKELQESNAFENIGLHYLNAKFEINYLNNDQRIKQKTNFRKSRNSKLELTQKEMNIEHHIGAFVITDSKGYKYVYALPVYNISSIDAQYSRTGEDLHNNGFVEKMNSLTNVKAINKKFKHISVTPAYPIAYKLTAIIGPDYVDIGEKGFSKEDHGYWMEVSYEKMNSNYVWRTPYDKDAMNRGYLNLEKDDVANFSMGEKEVYHPKFVRTKTHELEFTYEVRLDGRGFPKDKRENYSYKLSELNLYTTLENENRNLNSFKKVKFDYSYLEIGDLPNTIGNKNGKLKLDAIKFTFQNNNRSLEHPYRFTYYEPGLDKEYNLSEYGYNVNKLDRWGCYRNNVDKLFKKKHNTLDRTYFPYTLQNSTKWGSGTALNSGRKKDASVWNIKTITQPSGSSIKVNYELDDYAFVQDKQAMHMYEVINTGKIGSTDRIYFYLQEAINANNIDTARELLKSYFDNTGQIYFSVDSKIEEKSNEANSTSKISGYANFPKKPLFGNDFGFDETTKVGELYKRAWIKFPSENMGGEDLHPFVLGAFDHIRRAQPRLIYNKSVNEDDNLGSSAIGALTTIANQIGQTIAKGLNPFKIFNGRLINRGKELYEKGFNFIRLNTFNKKKIGGDHRVSSLVVYDGEPTIENFKYGKHYKYTTYDQEFGRQISSGVAHYEPSIGGDENALRRGLYPEHELLLTKEAYLGQEYPILEHLVGAPSVGYSEVKEWSSPSYAKYLSNLSKSPNQDLEILLNEKWPKDIPRFTDHDRYGTSGMTKHEFYTSKDFPIKFKHSNKIQKQKTNFNLLSASNSITSTQGFLVRKNNMHGKPKKVSYFPQSKSGELYDQAAVYKKYSYLKKNDNLTLADSIKVLKNDAPDGKYKIKTGKLAADIEVSIDAKGQGASEFTVGGAFNVDVVFILFGAIPIPTLWANAKATFYRSGSVTITKEICQAGILSQVESYDNGALSIIKMEYYDGITAEPIITSVTDGIKFGNAKNDKAMTIYNYGLGAFRRYRNMGPSSLNADAIFSINFGEANAENQFSENKDVKMIEANNPTYAAVYLINDSRILQSATYGNIPIEKGSDAMHFYDPKDNTIPLTEGDQFLILDANSNLVGKAAYVGILQGFPAFHIDKSGTASLNGLLQFKLVESGFKNRLDSKILNITSLSHPLKGRN